MWYELWDSETQNRIGDFDSKEDALRAVLEEVRQYGPGSSAVLSLGLLKRDSKHTNDALIAKGRDLVAIAEKLDQPRPGNKRVGSSAKTT